MTVLAVQWAASIVEEKGLCIIIVIIAVMKQPYTNLKEKSCASAVLKRN